MNSRVLGRFQKIVGFDVESFLGQANTFFSEDYHNIYAFFNGESDTIPKTSLEALISLDKNCITAQNNIRLRINRLTEYEFWDIVDFIGDIATKIKTTKNLSKWLRSSKTSFSFKTGTSFNFSLKGGQSFDKSVVDNIGDVDENQINQIAIQNSIEERDYSIEGGNKIKAFTNEANVSGVMNVTTIVDNPYGDKVYGIDIQKRIQWDSNDLKVLSYKETLAQAISIHSTIFKESVPEFPRIGFDPFVGNSVGGLSKPLIIRQLSEIFAQDDIFISAVVVDFKIKSDSVYLNFNIFTVLNEVIKNNDTNL